MYSPDDKIQCKRTIAYTNLQVGNWIMGDKVIVGIVCLLKRLFRTKKICYLIHHTLRDSLSSYWKV